MRRRPVLTSIVGAASLGSAPLAVTARDPPVAWDLLDVYYDNVSSISGSSFAERTRSFLTGNTDAILTSADERTHQPILDTSEADGDEAGVNSTPTFFLYSDGGFKSELVGVQDVTAFEAGFEV